MTIKSNKGNKTMTKKDDKNIFRRGDTYYIRYKTSGKVISYSLHTTSIEEARKKRNAILAGIQDRGTEKEFLSSVKRQLAGIDAEEEEERKDPKKGILLSDAFAKFERDPERKSCKPGQLAIHKANWKRFLEWMTSKHPEATHTREVTEPIIREWAADEYNSVKAINTYNHHITSVKCVFKTLTAYDVDFIDPTRNIHAKSDKADREQKQVFTNKELKAIFKYPEEEFCRLCAIGLYSTLRFSSARQLKWECYNGEEIEAIHDKTGADATFIVPQELKYWLDKVPPEQRKGYICPTYAKLNKANASHHFQATLQRAGIKTQIVKPGLNGENRTVTIKGYHSFRHTAITLALRNGATGSQVQRLAGHASLKMQANYTHLGKEDAGKAASLIGKFWQEPTEEKSK